MKENICNIVVNSKLISLESERSGNDENLIIQFKNNETIIKVLFFDILDVIYFKEKNVSSFIENKEDEDLTKKLKEMYEIVPKEHPYKSFSFKGPKENTFLKVIAGKMEIIKI